MHVFGPPARSQSYACIRTIRGVLAPCEYSDLQGPQHLHVLGIHACTRTSECPSSSARTRHPCMYSDVSVLRSMHVFGIHAYTRTSECPSSSACTRHPCAYSDVETSSFYCMSSACRHVVGRRGVLLPVHEFGTNACIRTPIVLLPYMCSDPGEPMRMHGFGLLTKKMSFAQM